MTIRPGSVAVKLPASGAGPGRAWLGGAGAAALAFAVYLLLVCLADLPVPPLDGHHLLGCACSDPAQQTWFLTWTSFALTHGLNPMLTAYINVPAGANLAINTSMPLLGVLGMPVMLVAGPVATFNLLLRLGLATSATVMFIVLRRYTHRWPAAFGGGLLFEFSAYMVGQAQRHLFLVFVPLAPLFIPLLDDWLVGLRRTPVRSGLLVGLVAGLEYLISPEIVLTSALFAVTGLAYLALRYREQAWQRLGILVRGLAAATPVFLVITGYAVWLLLAGPGRPVGPLHSLADLSRYHGDLLAPFVPTRNQAFAPGTLADVGNALVGGRNVENGFYLGIPLVALLCYLTFRCRRVPVVAVFAVVGAVAFVLSLGPELTFDGKVIFPVMPFALFEHLPILQNVEAARLSLFVQLAAAIIFGVGLDRILAYGWRAGPAQPAAGSVPPPPAASGPASLRSRLGTNRRFRWHVGAVARATRRSRRRFVRLRALTEPATPPGGRAGLMRPVAVAAVALVALAPVVPTLSLRSGQVATPPFFTSRMVRMIPPGSVALTFPYELAPPDQPIWWQVAASMRFRIIGGYAFVPGPGGRSTWRPVPSGPPVLRQVLLASTVAHPGPPPANPQAVAAIRQLCARYRVGVVLVDPAWRYGHAVAGLISRALRSPPVRMGRMDVWLQVQTDLRANHHR